jgi:hypothetical protein
VVLRLFVPVVVLRHVLERLDWCLLRHLRGGFFGIIVDSVPSGDGSSGSSGLFDAIVGLESMLSRHILSFSYSKLLVVVIQITLRPVWLIRF